MSNSCDESIPEAADASSIFSKLLQLLVGACRLVPEGPSGTSRPPMTMRGLSGEASHTSVRQLSDWLARR